MQLLHQFLIFLVLVEDLPPEGHLFRTDILFGTRNERRPLLIASGDLREELLEHNLTGLTLEAVR